MPPLGLSSSLLPSRVGGDVSVRIYATLCLALFFSVTAMGCGVVDPDDDDPATGSFELSYSGDASGSHSGVAIFFSDQGASTPNSFVLVGRDFSEAPDADTGFQVGRLGPVPDPGTYDLTAFEDPPEEIFGLGMQVDSRGLSAQATDGTVTFTEVGSDRVVGEFSATLAGRMDGNQNIAITATGSFEAVSCEENVENCPPDVQLANRGGK